MKASDFLDKCLCLDLETRGEAIVRIGAVRGDLVFERKGRFDLQASVRDLDRMAAGAEYLLGHNLTDHDIPILFRQFPGLDLLKKPIVDTLYLSPLAFPENPYHRLVKDYKLVREALNDPVADARLAASLFRDQWESFDGMNRAGRSRVLALYRDCFSVPGDSSGWMSREGMTAFFDALGIDGAAGVPDGERTDVGCEPAAFLGELLDGGACLKALGDCIGSLCRGRDNLHGPALAYSVAWLLVAGANSVLPPWVRLRFPNVTKILHNLRDIPCDDPGCTYCRSVHDPADQLKRYFGFNAFRPDRTPADDGVSLQERIVTSGLRDESLLAILPTGGGKSLCYQLPALVRHFRRGLLTIVITPLQALMKDQVDNLLLKTGGQSAAALYGLLTPPERGEVLERTMLGDVAILYVAPEQLRNASFRKAIAYREIGCWVFDEAHCLSKWGHDFRPDYLYAARFIREFAREQRTAVPPIACYTATAKQDVKEEIVDYFRREVGVELRVFEGSVERENLRFEVQMVTRAEKYPRIHEILSDRLPDESGSALVYTSTRSGAEAAAEYLHAKGWSAAAFHAGLSVPEKRSVQESFITGDIRVICATNAFGMGIDKEDVRLVLHADIPGSLENYLQEAGRAGRDLRDSECVLLYDLQDVEMQFKLGAVSELNQRDIIEILRGVRRARRNQAGEVVITTGEVLRDDEVNTSFDVEDRQADTKVKTAVSWLERAGFLERNQNNTRVFQGRPLVRDLAEAESRIGKLGLSQRQKARWLAVLKALINAGPAEGMSADELAELPAFGREAQNGGEPKRHGESETEQVLRTLHDMAEVGLIKKGLLLTAFVRHKVKTHSQLIFERICALEDDMLKLMRESAPDAAGEGWLELSLRSLNQRLVDLGHTDSSTLVLAGLLKSLSLDGRGLAGSRGSIELRHMHREHYRVKLQRDWDILEATAKKRRLIAKVALDTILARIPDDAPVSAELLVSFSSDDIAQALHRNIYLAGQIKDTLAAIDRGLMFLHEQRVVILQQGLAVFRQAMTIRVLPDPGRRRYTKSDYEPLQLHYRERVLQVHVMNEYARLGLEKIREALELVLAYFSLDKSAFVKRFFPGRKDIIERATSQESYRRIVEELGSSAQMQVVTAPEESNILVLAGPGSGKTRVVVHRCAYLLRVKRVPARSILVICFNRNAATALRRRLDALVGPDARGVVVQTYHGLAMRLTGTSFHDLAEKGRSELPDFDRLIPDAIALLRGEKETLGLEPDEMRDLLLAGYRHILVDEYQDIDREQYDMISALAGRTEKDRERRLNILAVGDDDQNIYTFRGANVEFIRRFQSDYSAQSLHLMENYRSTGHIIAACNSLISHNSDRMKTKRAIEIDKGRRDEPAGGVWASLDPVARGRVQIFEVTDASGQAGALVSEMKRLKSLRPDLSWSAFAVLSRTHEVLAPIRAMCEEEHIPVVFGLKRDKVPALYRIREIAAFLDELKARRGSPVKVSSLRDGLPDAADGGAGNVWLSRLREVLDSRLQDAGDVEVPAQQLIEYIYESLIEQRRDQFIGTGVFLSTVHSAKGMEFPHVLIPDGGWSGGRSTAEMEEERRVFYVGMTRAKETLALFARQDMRNPFFEGLEGDFVVRRKGAASAETPAEALRCRYELLGMQDIFLDFAGRRGPEDPVHSHLQALQPGSRLTAVKAGNRVELKDREGHAVALLSKSAAQVWMPRLERIREIRVIGMVRRECREAGEAYAPYCRSERWDVPWVEIMYTG
jgi:ATP-dependent DNA helicase RecQ